MRANPESREKVNLIAAFADNLLAETCNLLEEKLVSGNLLVVWFLVGAVYISDKQMLNCDTDYPKRPMANFVT